MNITPTTVGSRKTKNLPLESLRGIAALCVALYHFQTLSPLTNNAFISHSYLMVDFFFVLSGYVIALNYIDRIKNFNDLLSFQIRRFWRLYPLHFATLMLYVGLEFAKYLFQQKTGIAPNDIPFEKNSLFAFINHLFMTHALFPAEATFNTRSWSISTEFYTYLLFGIVLILAKKRFAIVSVLLSISGFIIVYALSDTIYVITRLAYFRCVYSFFLGVTIFILAEKINFKSNTALLIILIIGSILGIAYGGKTQFEFFVPLIFSLLIFNIIIIDKSNIIYRILSKKYLVFLGTISYSIYLIHAFVWFCFRQTGRFIFNIEVIVTPDDRAFVVFQPLAGTVVTILGLGIIIAISYVTYTQIESRFRKGIKLRNRG